MNYSILSNAYKHATIKHTEGPVQDEYFTVDEVKDRFKVTRQTVYNWIKSGDLPAVKIGRSVRITAKALDAFRKPVEPDDPLLASPTPPARE
jgi:excisionase family DNA binding protein